MTLPRLLALLLLIATATPGCTTMNRVGNSVESGARSVGRGTSNFFGNLFGRNEEEKPSPRRRSRPKPVEDAPPTLESTPQEYVGS